MTETAQQQDTSQSGAHENVRRGADCIEMLVVTVKARITRDHPRLIVLIPPAKAGQNSPALQDLLAFVTGPCMNCFDGLAGQGKESLKCEDGVQSVICRGPSQHNNPSKQASADISRRVELASSTPPVSSPVLKIKMWLLRDQEAAGRRRRRRAREGRANQRRCDPDRPIFKFSVAVISSTKGRRQLARVIRQSLLLHARR